jgi:hypothetical protein
VLCRVVQVSLASGTNIIAVVGHSGHYRIVVCTATPNAPSTTASGKLTARAIPGTSPSVVHWQYGDTLSLYRRRYLLRHTAIEVLTEDGRSLFVSFDNKSQADEVFDALMKKSPAVVKEVRIEGRWICTCQGVPSCLCRYFTCVFWLCQLPAMQVPEFAGGDTTSVFDTAASAVARIAVPRDAYATLTAKTLRQATASWEDGSISNFEYLMALNALAGRSFNDLTQYPVRSAAAFLFVMRK